MKYGNAPNARTPSASRRKLFCGEARRTLFLRSNWISVLFVLFSVCFFLVGAAYFMDCLYYAIVLSGIFETDSALLYPVFVFCAAFFLFLLLSPLLPGLKAYCCDLYRSRTEEALRVPPTEVFCCYASLEAVVRAWKLVFFRMTAIAALPLALLISVWISELLRAVCPPLLSVLCGIFAAVLLLIPACILCVLTTPLLYLSVTRPELTVSGCLRESARVMRYRIPEYLVFRLGFLPWLLLSVCSAGLLFFVYVLPYLIFADISFCFYSCSDIRSV